MSHVFRERKPTHQEIEVQEKSSNFAYCVTEYPPKRDLSRDWKRNREEIQKIRHCQIYDIDHWWVVLKKVDCSTYGYRNNLERPHVGPLCLLYQRLNPALATDIILKWNIPELETWSGRRWPFRCVAIRIDCSEIGNFSSNETISLLKMFASSQPQHPGELFGEEICTGEVSGTKIGSPRMTRKQKLDRYLIHFILWRGVAPKADGIPLKYNNLLISGREHRRLYSMTEFATSTPSFPSKLISKFLRRVHLEKGVC